MKSKRPCPTKKAKSYADGGYVTKGKKPAPKAPPKQPVPPKGKVGSTRDTLQNLRKRQMEDLGA